MRATGHRWRPGVLAAIGLVLIGLCGAYALRSQGAKAKVTVLAAASLTDAFVALADGFEQRNPDTEVELVFAGSQILRMQVQAGAPGDLFASAHPEHLAALEGSGHAWPAQDLARNRLAVIVGKEHGAMDLASAVELPRWILGSAQVPVGRYTEVFLNRLAQELGPAPVSELRNRVLSREPNVRMVRTKVEMGQADAAVVYASDVRSGVQVQELPLPAHLQVEVEYQIAELRGAQNQGAAKRFMAFARSAPGQEILVQAGFLPRKEAREL